jgi:hypothetical protein
MNQNYLQHLFVQKIRNYRKNPFLLFVQKTLMNQNYLQHRFVQKIQSFLKYLLIQKNQMIPLIRMNLMFQKILFLPFDPMSR